MVFSVRVFLSRLLAAAFVVLALVLPLHGASAANLDVLDKGPAIGTPIPHRLTVSDQNNQVRDFETLKRKNGLILLFSRSFDW